MLPSERLQRFAAQLGDAPQPAPVDDWDPPLSGTLDMRISADGGWHYRGSPIHRRRLVRLFARVLRRDADGEYYLVTPVEKWQIQVEDTPFLITDVNPAPAPGVAPVLRFRSSLGDVIDADAEHPLRVDYAEPGGEPRPYLLLRGRLWGRLTPAVFLQLAEAAEVDVNGAQEQVFVARSGTARFVLGPCE